MINSTDAMVLQTFQKFSKLLPKIRQIHNKANLDDEYYSKTIFAHLNNKKIHEVEHTKILGTILQYNKCRFVSEFIEALNETKPNLISPENYASPKIKIEERGELGQTDILVLGHGDDSRHAIIIENKICNAGDQEFQLPCYYKQTVKEEYKVDAVVYLPIHKENQPDDSDWKNPELCKKYDFTTKDRKNLKKALIIFPAICPDNSRYSSLLGFIRTCNEKLQKHRTEEAKILRSTIIQYEKLLENITTEERMSDVHQDIYTLLQKAKITTKDIENLGEFFKHGAKNLENFAQARLKYILKEGGINFDNGWQENNKEWSVYKPILLGNVSDNESRKTNLTVDIGIGWDYAEDDSYKIYSFLSRSGSSVSQKKFKECINLQTDFLNKSKLEWDKDDGCFLYCISKSKADEKLSEEDEKAIEYVKTSLQPSIEMLEKRASAETAVQKKSSSKARKT